MAVLFSGGAYLEMRLQRMLTQTQRTNEFRTSWFNARRTLIHARRITEEFATYVAEDGYGHVDFLFGKARMTVPRARHDQLRRLHGNAQVTAMHMADDLDELSEFLDSQYQPQIEAIFAKLNELQLPHTYDAVVLVARDIVSLYELLVQTIGDTEGFAA